MPDERLIWRILEIESRAGRVEGFFAADPELARMWRAQAALTEACRSVGLEDIHVFEGDVIHRHLENRLTDPEGARGTASVAQLLRFIVSPGSLFDDPERCVSRAWEVAVSMEGEDVLLDLSETALLINRSLRDAPTPLLGALRASIIHRIMTESRSPSADRLIFMAAEHSLRAGGAQYDLGQDYPDALLRRMNASWIYTPSIALTQGRFRAWSPASDLGHLDLLEGISLELDRTLGAMPVLRRWRDEARTFAAGKHGKSRLRDLVDLAVKEPILTAPHVRRMLGVSEKTSLNLMEEAQTAGILSLITPRKSYRVWATPVMAQTLRMRASRTSTAVRRDALDVQKAEREVADVRDIEHELIDREEDLSPEERANAALAEVDAAIANVDAVLAKYRKKEV